MYMHQLPEITIRRTVLGLGVGIPPLMWQVAGAEFKYQFPVPGTWYLTPGIWYLVPTKPHYTSLNLTEPH